MLPPGEGELYPLLGLLYPFEPLLLLKPLLLLLEPNGCWLEAGEPDRLLVAELGRIGARAADVEGVHGRPSQRAANYIRVKMTPDKGHERTVSQKVDSK